MSKEKQRIERIAAALAGQSIAYESAKILAAKETVRRKLAKITTPAATGGRKSVLPALDGAPEKVVAVPPAIDPHDANSHKSTLVVMREMLENPRHDGEPLDKYAKRLSACAKKRGDKGTRPQGADDWRTIIKKFELAKQVTKY